MFENLEDLSVRYEEVLMEMNDPALTGDQTRFRKLMKEHAELTPLVEAYRKYKAANQTIADSIDMLDSEGDDEMRELLKEELAQAKEDVAKLENEIKILLLPKDPNDDKNVVVEIRAGAGGDEAALFSAELYRMYVHYAEAHHWKVEMVDCKSCSSSAARARILA